jgi:predicted transcriptional regulator
VSVCPACHETVPAPVHSWSVSDKTQNSQGKLSLFIILFECPKCKTKFTARTLSKDKPETTPQIAEASLRTVNVKNKIERLSRVRDKLMATLKDLREKIKTLEEEKARLTVEVDGLRKAAESRVVVLEGEVSQLREEAKSLHEFLGEKAPSAPNGPNMQNLSKPT